MTREEQVDWLCRLRADLNNGVIFTPWNGEFTEALDGILEPCTDAISRQAVLDMLEDINAETEGVGFYYKHYVEYIKNLPPVTPQYTEAEIQKMQDLESAEIQTAYEIGKAEGSEVLDKIRAEIDSYCSDNRDRNDGLYIAMRIIDKYKASPTGEEVEE